MSDEKGKSMLTTHHWLDEAKSGMPFAAVSGNPAAVWLYLRDHETDTLAKAYIPAAVALELGQAIVEAARARIGNDHELTI